MCCVVRCRVALFCVVVNCADLCCMMVVCLELCSVCDSIGLDLVVLDWIALHCSAMYNVVLY